MESVTKHDTSSLKLQGQRSPLHAIQLGCSRGWQQLTGPGSSMKNMQSGAPSCLIDMLIARSVFKHTCSFTRRKHSRRNYVTTHRKPVIKLQSVHFFFLGSRRWVAQINAHKSLLEAARYTTSSVKWVQRQVHCHDTTHEQHQISERSLRGNFRVPRKLSYFCHFHYS